MQPFERGLTVIECLPIAEIEGALGGVLNVFNFKKNISVLLHFELETAESSTSILTHNSRRQDVIYLFCRGPSLMIKACAENGS
jgi:hypothetical protein